MESKTINCVRRQLIENENRLELPEAETWGWSKTDEGVPRYKEISVIKKIHRDTKGNILWLVKLLDCIFESC